jgi:aryl carrier-like protein
LSEIDHHLNALSVEQLKYAGASCIIQRGVAASKLVAFLWLTTAPTAKELDCASAAKNRIIQTVPLEVRELTGALMKVFAEKLPAHMNPSAYFVLEHAPLTAAGKLDRRSARELAEGLSEQSWNNIFQRAPHRQAPSTFSGLKLRELWANVLGLDTESISSYDSFFHEGGDSIRAIRLSQMARQQGMQLSVHSIFQHPILADMVDALVKVDDQDTQPPTAFSLLPDDPGRQILIKQAAVQCELPRRDIEDLFPATPLQQGLMASSLRRRGLYLTQQIFQVPKGGTVARFQKAWKKVEAAFPAMRSRIVTIEDAGELLVTTNSPSIWSESEDLDEYLEWDLDVGVRYGGPLSRFGLVSVQKDNVYLVWTAHHAIYDGWTMRKILVAVERVYHDNISLNKAPSLAGYVKHLIQRDMIEENRYWEEALSGVVGVSFPKPPAPAALLAPDGFCQRFVATPASIDGIITSTLVQAAWALSLAHLTRCADVVFGLTLSGRDVSIPGITDFSGPTLTTVPRRIKVDYEAIVKEYLLGVQHSGIEMMPHVHAGLQSINKLSEDARRACDFNNLLVIQPRETQIDEQSSLEICRVKDRQTSWAAAALTTTCELGSAEIAISFAFDTHSMSQAVAEALLMRFEKAIVALGTQRKVAISKLPAFKSDYSLLDKSVVVDSSGPSQVSLSSPSPTSASLSSAGSTSGSSSPRLTQALTAEAKMADIGCGTSILRARVSNPKLSPPSTQTYILRTSDFEEIGTTLRNIWAKTLSVPVKLISPGAHFFELGGDSVMAMRLVHSARLKGLQLRTTDVFSHPTLNAMIAVCDDRSSSSADLGMLSGTNSIPIESGILHDIKSTLQQVGAIGGSAEIAAVAPVLDYQAMCLTASAMADRGFQNLVQLHFESTPNIVRLQNACEQILEAHAILRTAFLEYDASLWQVTLQRPHLNLRSTEPPRPVMPLVNKQNAGPIQPPVMFELVKVDTGKYRLDMHINHALYDGASLPRILEDLRAAYLGQTIPQSAPFHLWAVQAHAPSVASSEHWRQLLTGSSMTTLVMRSSPSIGNTLDTMLQASTPLAPLSKGSHTPATFLSAAWSLLLAEACDVDDVLFGQVVSNRTFDVGHSVDTIGPCMNIVPVRTKVSSSAVVHDFLQDVQDQHAASLPYQAHGFRDLIRTCTSWQNWTRFSTIIQYQNIGPKLQDSKLDFGNEGGTCSVTGVGRLGDAADLWLVATPEIEMLRLELTYSRRAVPAPVAHRLSQRLVQILRDIGTDSGKMADTCLGDVISDIKPPPIPTPVADEPCSVIPGGGNRNESPEAIGGNMTGTVTDAWKQAGLLVQNITPSDTAFDRGADMVDLLILRECYRSKGFEVSVDELVQNCTFRKQQRLLQSKRVVCNY